MSRKKEEILKRLRELGATVTVNVPGKVKSVDDNTKTCTVTIDDLDYDKIRLTAVLDDDNDNHSYLKPVIGSWVIVSFIENSETDAYVSIFSEIDKVFLNANEIVFNKGELKGLVKIEKLIEKMNKLEDDLNAIKQAFSSWVPVPQDGGAALKTASSTWSSQQLQKTNLNDLENEKIKQ